MNAIRIFSGDFTSASAAGACVAGAAWLQADSNKLTRTIAAIKLNGKLLFDIFYSFDWVGKDNTKLTQSVGEVNGNVLNKCLVNQAIQFMGVQVITISLLPSIEWGIV
jgi:uncharacterized protein (DUF2141 family)